MGKKDLVSEEVLQELITKLEEIINNYCHNLEYFTPTEIEGFFDGTQQEIDYYSSLIKDDVVSKNFLHSSKQIADDIAKSILEANEYTDSLLKNISTIQLKYVTSLPTSSISEHTIYILKASDGTSKDTLNLYNETDGSWTSIGDFNISLDDYYTKTEIDTKMDLKANKTEVIANDKIMQTLDSTTNSADTVLSTSGLQTEMDKKVDKTSIVTSVASTSTDDTVPSAKGVFDIFSKAINGNTMKFKADLDDCSELTSSRQVSIQYHTLNSLNKPSKNYGIVLTFSVTEADQLVQYCFENNGGGKIYTRFRNKSNGVYSWSNWYTFNSTNVTDVPMSSLSINNTNAFSEGTITYNVTNGVCNLTLAGLTKNLCSAYQLSTTSFPTPKNKLVTIPIINDVNGEIVGMFYIDSNYSSIPTCHIYKPGCRGFCSISYAVAES